MKKSVENIYKEIDALIDEPKDDIIDSEIESNDIVEDVTLEETN